MPWQTVMRPLSTFLLLLLLLPGAAPARALPAGEITVEDYCRLTQSLLELSVKEWEERADLAASNKGDRKAMAAKFEKVTKHFRPLRAEVYARHGMTPAEDLRYASDHRQEIADYFDENPDVRDAFDSLKARLNELIKQVESGNTPPEGGSK